MEPTPRGHQQALTPTQQAVQTTRNALAFWQRGEALGYERPKDDPILDASLDYVAAAMPPKELLGELAARYKRSVQALISEALPSSLDEVPDVSDAALIEAIERRGLLNKIQATTSETTEGPQSAPNGIVDMRPHEPLASEAVTLRDAIWHLIPVGQEFTKRELLDWLVRAGRENVSTNVVTNELSRRKRLGELVTPTYGQWLRPDNPDSHTTASTAARIEAGHFGAMDGDFAALRNARIEPTAHHNWASPNRRVHSDSNRDREGG